MCSEETPHVEIFHTVLFVDVVQRCALTKGDREQAIAVYTQPWFPVKERFQIEQRNLAQLP